MRKRKRRRRIGNVPSFFSLKSLVLSTIQTANDLLQLVFDLALREIGHIVVLRSDLDQPSGLTSVQVRM